MAADERREGASAAQLELASLHPCTTCHGHGRVDDRETESDIKSRFYVTTTRCPTCHGAGTLDYNPEDRSLIPF